MKRILTVEDEPFLGDETAVADDADARHAQLALAESDQLAQIAALLVDERLTARKVDLFHSLF